MDKLAFLEMYLDLYRNYFTFFLGFANRKNIYKIYN